MSFDDAVKFVKPVCPVCTVTELWANQSECDEYGGRVPPGPSTFECWSNEYPMCPHCGHLHRDAEEFTDGRYDCEKCDKEFKVSTETWVRYTTTK